MMKPFSHRQLNYMQRIYNYRLSRARRVIENIFGIITKKFRVFEKPMLLEPPKVKKITLAACVLHNFFIDRKTEDYTNTLDVDNVDAETGKYKFRISIKYYSNTLYFEFV